jgi:Ca-activated chloride channel family protein
MGLAGLCSHRLCPNVFGFSLSFLLALTVVAPPSHSQSPGSPPAGPRNTTDQTSSEVDTAHVSIPTLREGRKSALRVDVNLVTVPVTVTDAMSHAVTGLRKEDFALYEGDTKQEIRYFSEEDGPISVGLILDLSKSMINKIDTERAAVEEFFQIANPDDDYFVITVSSHPKLIASSTRSIRAIETELGLAVPDGNTALLDAIYLGVEQMHTARYKRHALLIISDGGDNNSRYKLREIKSIVQESDVAVYAIGLFDTALFKTFEEYMGKKWLGEITDASGGRTIAIDDLSRLPQTAAAISWELRNQYVLGYQPASVVADGRWRKIKVNVMPRGKTPSSSPSRLQAYYRKGYSASGR